MSLSRHVFGIAQTRCGVWVFINTRTTRRSSGCAWRTNKMYEVDSVIISRRHKRNSDFAFASAQDKARIMGSRPMTGPAAVQRTYEDFAPSTEWANESQADTLLLYLPGFKKEQLKVQLTSTRALRISGEREVGENKWSRFHKEVLVASHYDTDRISAKYERGILYIRLVKIITPEEEAAAKVTEPEQHNKTPSSQGKMQPSPEAPLHPKQQEPSAQESPEKVIPSEKPRQDEDSEEKTEDVSLRENLRRRRKENGNTTTDEGAVDAGGKFSSASAVETAKITTGNCGHALTGLAMELKQPRKLMKLGVTIFCFLVIVMYAINAFRSLRKPDN